MDRIKDKLDAVLEFIGKYSEQNGYSPSVREICSAVGIKSTATCQYYLQKLVDNGSISKTDLKKRTLKLNVAKTDFISVPIVRTITAGTPVFDYENLEGYCPLPSEFGNENELFMLKVKGFSMVNAGILDGDKIIVKKQSVADDGQIVAALVDDSATVKRFFRRNGKVVLHPENENMSDIVLSDAVILGVVTGLIRKF